MELSYPILHSIQRGIFFSFLKIYPAHPQQAEAKAATWYTSQSTYSPSPHATPSHDRGPRQLFFYGFFST